MSFVGLRVFPVGQDAILFPLAVCLMESLPHDGGLVPTMILKSGNSRFCIVFRAGLSTLLFYNRWTGR